MLLLIYILLLCVLKISQYSYKFLLVNHVLKKCFKLEKNLSYYIFNMSVSFILLCRCKFPSCIPFLPSEELPVTFAVLVCWQWNLLASVCMKNFISMCKWYFYWIFFLIELFPHHLLKIKSEIILFPPVLFFSDSF